MEEIKIINEKELINKKAKATDRCVFSELKEVTFTVEGTTAVVMKINDPFMDPRGFTNSACYDLMLKLAGNMLDYASETCFYIKYNNRGMVLTRSMFEYV